ncbi:MAG: LuxR C-terminal-related transcriptional regulator [Ignavibacterium sp.]|nr:LuxR C-terminal-related transcriptional regulator [Ignavibacterium sp.]
MKSLIKKLLQKFNWKNNPQPFLEIELTDLEKIVLEKISIGMSYQKISEELDIPKEDVKKIIRAIYEKIHSSKIKQLK